MDELLPKVIKNRPQTAPLNNNRHEQAADTMFVSLLLLSFKTAASKQLTDKVLQMIIATGSLREIKEKREQAFMKSGNRTLERYKFLAREQKDRETLRQFWHTLTSFAATCEFGEQLQSPILDVFTS